DVRRAAEQEQVVDRVRVGQRPDGRRETDRGVAVLSGADGRAGVRVGATDRQEVDAVRRVAGVEDVDDVVARVSAAARRVDEVRVVGFLTVEGQRVAGRDVHRLQLLHVEEVVAGATDRAERRGRVEGRRRREV